MFVVQVGVTRLLSVDGRRHRQMKFCMERPLKRPHLIGAEMGLHLFEVAKDEYSGEGFILPHNGGFEVAGTYKYVFERGLFKKIDRVYAGTDLRWGIRRLRHGLNDPSISQMISYSRDRSWKLLLRIGQRLELGHFVFDWALPFGFEWNEQAPQPTYNSNVDDFRFVITPCLTLGFAF